MTVYAVLHTEENLYTLFGEMISCIYAQFTMEMCVYVLYSDVIALAQWHHVANLKAQQIPEHHPRSRIA